MPAASPALDQLKAQLAQVEQLIAEGTLRGKAAKRRREELEQQILSAVTSAEAAAAGGATRERAPRSLLFSVAAFILAFGFVGYAAMGNRDGWNVGPGENVAAAGEEPGSSHSTQAAQIEEMIAKLAERMKTTPDDAEGWQMLARSYSASGKYAEALPAYQNVVRIRPDDAQALADYADALAVVNNRSLEGEPEKYILKALQADPKNVKALSLAGTVAFNRNDFKAAAGLWERALKGSDPNADFTRQLMGAVKEARQRAGLPPLEMPAAEAAPQAAAAAAPPAAAEKPAEPVAPGPGLQGRVTASAAAKAAASPDDIVFIFARAATGSRMPLAILRKKVSELPIDFTLDDTLAMNPAMKLSSVPQLVVGARITKTGNAVPASGDWQVLSAPVALGAKGLALEIGERVP